MLSKLSKEFLKWILEENNNDISKFYMLDKSLVPEKLGNNLWGILDELKSNSIVKNVRKYGQSLKQQCDFSFLPIALDYGNDDINTDSINGQTETINVIENQKNITNEYNAPINNSNISTGDNVEQEIIMESKEETKGWFWRNMSWVVPMIVGVVVAIVIAVIWS